MGTGETRFETKFNEDPVSLALWLFRFLSDENLHESALGPRTGGNQVRPVYEIQDYCWKLKTSPVRAFVESCRLVNETAPQTSPRIPLI
jgi:hypothetical protein